MNTTVKKFLDAIGRSQKPKDTEIEVGEMYRLYTVFCQQNGLTPIPQPAFWQEVKAACPNLDLGRVSYTFGELQAIIIIDTHENPVVSWYVSTLRAQIEDHGPPSLNAHDVFLSFYSWLCESYSPKDKIIRCSKLYDMYRDFCERRKYNKKYDPLDFWKHTKREFPELDYEKVFTFEEFRKILAENLYAFPF